MFRVAVLIVPVILCGGCGSSRGSAPPARLALETPHRDQAPELPEPTSEKPVTAAAWMTPPDLSPGETAELRVRLRIAPGHHLYVAASPDAVGIPVSLKLRAVDYVQTVGEWKLPPGDGNKHLAGVVEFSQAVRVSERAAAGAHDVAVDVRYQACTPELCWPPQTLTVNAPLVVSPKAKP